MKLNSIQISIFLVQLVAIAFNLYSIFIKRVSDSGGHWIAICFLLTIMFLSFKSWHDAAEKEESDLN